MKRALGSAVSTVLVLAACCLLGWLAYSATSGATLVTFRTGSMSPTIPQGAIAVSLPVEASEIQPGDVVTVNRLIDNKPVTHRVVMIHGRTTTPNGVQLTPKQRELVLKGDDNDYPDADHYVVDQARKVVFAVPGAGAALLLVQSQLGMGLMVLVAGGLTVWAFWPGRPTHQQMPRHRTRRHSMAVG